MKEMENWKDVVGYEGWYEISDWGNVKRVKKWKGAVVGRVLRNQTDKYGYRSVYLNRDGSRRFFRIHRLVAAAFIGVCPDGKEVNHKDGRKANNHLENLEYVTSSENQRHSYAMGLRSNRGEKAPNSKLKEEDVRKIILRIGKETHKSIAADFNVGRSTIAAIACGQNWAYLKEEDDDERT